jgi:hypothetical protein
MEREGPATTSPRDTVSTSDQQLHEALPKVGKGVEPRHAKHEAKEESNMNVRVNSTRQASDGLAALHEVRQASHGFTRSALSAEDGSRQADPQLA